MGYTCSGKCVDMMTNRGQEFEIKIAKAKDLPPSWFDLVLRPDAFKQHLKTLETNPNGELRAARAFSFMYGYYVLYSRKLFVIKLPSYNVRYVQEYGTFDVYIMYCTYVDG